jgi:hydrogenase-1 operon protein HyaF
MKDFPVPVTAFDPGPQSVADDVLAFLPMPKAEPLVTPIPPESASRDELLAAADVVEQLLEAMARYAPGDEGAPRFSLRAVAPGTLRALNESLGQGEVSVVVAGVQGRPDWHVQETAFAGVWRVQRIDGRGRLVEDILEAGDMPGVVREAARQESGARLDAGRLPKDVMNAPALVNEIRHHAGTFRVGQPAHVLNLSLLPLAPADHEGLDAILGEGSVAILSRGFGNCRINSTQVRSVWRVRYFNSMNTLILDTIEVVDIPEAAKAAVDDYEDSMERLRDLLSWLREG